MPLLDIYTFPYKLAKNGCGSDAMIGPFEQPESFAPFRADASFRSRIPLVLDDGDSVILNSFTTDVIEAAISCVSFASFFNAAAFTRRLALPADLARFAPSYPHSFAVVRGCALSSHLTPAVRLGMQAFTDYLRQMRQDLPALQATAAMRQGIAREDVAPLRDVTLTACCFAKLTLKDLVTIHERTAANFEAAQLRYLVAMLDDVLEGRSPLFVDGRIEKPKSQFLSRERRVHLNADAIVAEHANRERVVVSDISRGGLAFQGYGIYEPGQKLEIRLVVNGRDFHGKVLWRNRNKAGMGFRTPLPPNDELLRVGVT